MDLLSSELVRPLRIAENDFLQVLVPRFSLTRCGRGNKLQVSFDEDAPTIWKREAKHELELKMYDFKRKASKIQKELEAFLLGKEPKEYRFHDADFLFRYASGGALPVLRMGENEYYCFFYREISPIGWNIANGGCDSKEELLNPLDTIERELREELLIVDTKNEKRYVFEADAGKPLDRPEFAMALRFWEERFRQLDFPRFEELVIPLKWLNGPDCLEVQIGDEEPRKTEGCFLNINAIDYGIEVDRIAKVNVDEDAILLDGEPIGEGLVNAAVGLFEVSRLNVEVQAEAKDFFPDIVFFDAERYDRKKARHVVQDKFLPRAADIYLKEREVEKWKCSEHKYDLCPVTKNLMKRHLLLQAEEAEPAAIAEADFDVFISFSRTDTSAAKRVHDFLVEKGYRVFFSEETLHESDFGPAIDAGLDSAACLVGVATKPENLKRPWVRYEWTTFFYDIMSKRKKHQNPMIVAFFSGFHPADLPRPFRLYKWIEYDECAFDRRLDELWGLIRTALGR